jgi:hypothetical protein
MVFGMATALAMVAGEVRAKDITAGTPAAIKAAIAAAKPGDTVVVQSGDYDMGDRVNVNVSGEKGNPITVRCAGEKGYAVWRTRGGNRCCSISGSHLVFIGIHFAGDAKGSDDIVFLQPSADDLRFTDCKISGSGMFGVKTARSRETAVDDFVFEHCELFDVASTGFDMVCGDRCVLRGNFIHDYGKAGGGATHYGIFMKGGGKHGIIEGNVVDGGNRRGVLVGISFGGGLTGAQWLPLVDGKAAPEHEGGIARNNIVMNVSDDAYSSNNASGCRWYNNLSWNCRTFRRPRSYPPDPVLVNNLIQGPLRDISPESKGNVTELRQEWFASPDDGDFRLTAAGQAALADKAVPVAAEDNPTDFFGSERDPRSAVVGPVLPNARQSTKWIDRRK